MNIKKLLCISLFCFASVSTTRTNHVSNYLIALGQIGNGLAQNAAQAGTYFKANSWDLLNKNQKTLCVCIAVGLAANQAYCMYMNHKIKKARKKIYKTADGSNPKDRKVTFNVGV